MYGVLGEDESDKQTIVAILRELTKTPGLPCPGKGFKGLGNLLNEGSKYLTALHRSRGCSRFVICVDADEKTHDERLAEVTRKVVQPAAIPADCRVVVAVKMIEAWILADIDRALKLWKPKAAWTPKPIPSPESIRNPKAELIRMSREGGVSPRYDPVGDNPRIAPHLDYDRVAKTCPSFARLREFVLGMT